MCIHLFCPLELCTFYIILTSITFILFSLFQLFEERMSLIGKWVRKYGSWDPSQCCICCVVKIDWLKEVTIIRSEKKPSHTDSDTWQCFYLMDRYRMSHPSSLGLSEVLWCLLPGGHFHYRTVPHLVFDSNDCTSLLLSQILSVYSSASKLSSEYHE
jgi:hypothetical protein